MELGRVLVSLFCIIVGFPVLACRWSLSALFYTLAHDALGRHCTNRLFLYPSVCIQPFLPVFVLHSGLFKETPGLVGCYSWCNICIIAASPILFLVNLPNPVCFCWGLIHPFSVRLEIEIGM